MDPKGRKCYDNVGEKAALRECGSTTTGKNTMKLVMLKKILLLPSKDKIDIFLII